MDFINLLRGLLYFINLIRLLLYFNNSLRGLLYFNNLLRGLLFVLHGKVIAARKAARVGVRTTV